MNPSASQAYAMRLATAFMPCETMRTEVEAIGHLNSPVAISSQCFRCEDPAMTNVLLPTSLVGSYGQPDWLIDRKKLAGRFPPRVRARELWRVPPEFLEEGQDDATLGLVPKQMSTGDRTILGRKRGNRHLRDAKMTTAMPDRLTHYRATSSKSETRVGASKCAATITRPPALASSRHPRPTPTARALPSGLVARRGQNWTPIRGQICALIDDLRSSGNLLGRPPGFVASTAPCPGRRPGCRGAHDFV